MNELHIYNEYIYEKYKLIKNVDELSCPLLVNSTDNYISKLNNRIMYVGQETNGWLNDIDDKFYSVNEIEKVYYEFLVKSNYNKPFWQFIKSIIGDNKVVDNIIWCNTLISGKKIGIGAPDDYKDIQQMGLEYLLFIYDYIKPNAVVFVNGPNNPYYDVTMKFLKLINSNIDNCPTLNNSLIIDEEKKVFWTYHPSYQNRKNLIETNKEIIKKVLTK